MSGHCIESEDFVIVVDKWDASFLRRPGCKPHYFFLTHLHADHIKGLTSTWSRLVYTSPFNAWLLPMRRNVKPMLLKELELNITHSIRKSNDGIAFQVTLLDANHCPGAVMFLFQGKFGNILYTGDFRYTPRILDNPILSPIIRNKELSVLYLDNTYAAASCKFPPREEALKQVLEIIDKHPDSKILIGMRQLGKEEVLRAVALHVQERVCVSVQRLQILTKLEYEDVFTTDTTLSRIHAVELHNITQKHLQEAPKVVSIKLTSMYDCGSMEKQRGSIYVVPYSDHSSHTELMEFVDHLRPLKLYPIVQPKIPKMTADTGPWYKMSTINCVLPDEMLQLCGPSADRVTSVSSTFGQVLPPSPGLSIKFHLAPKRIHVEKKTSNVTYYDEGLDILPFDNLGSQLTNNNKARKHIKASWTRLAPKILSQKGIKFDDGKTSDQSQEHLPNNLSGGLLPPASQEVEKKDGKISNVPSSDHEESLLEVPLSDGDDDLDMPSSARALHLRMELPINGPVSNGVSEDRKSECSSEMTVGSLRADVIDDSSVARRTRNRGVSNSPGKQASRDTLNNSKDSDSDVSSSKRTTRSKGSVSSLPVVSRPKTRLSHGSIVEEPKYKSPHSYAKPSEKRLKDSKVAGAEELKKTASNCGSVKNNGLDEKSVSLENLSSTSKGGPSRNLRRSESKDSIMEVIETSSRMSSRSTRSTKVSESETNPLENFSQSSELKEVSVEGKNEGLATVKSEPDLCTSLGKDQSSIESFTGDLVESFDFKKHLLNGAVGEDLDGVHINSPGRKRIPLSCDWDVAQEIAKKETEQALKALESLNQMKGFRTRGLGNRSGLVALRRLSVDSNAPKSVSNSQSLVVLPPPPSGLRPRTASILSSMADTFSKPLTASSATKQPSTSSSVTTRSAKSLSPVPDLKKSLKSPAKKETQSSGVKKEGRNLLSLSKQKKSLCASEKVQKTSTAMEKKEINDTLGSKVNSPSKKRQDNENVSKLQEEEKKSDSKETQTGKTIEKTEESSSLNQLQDSNRSKVFEPKSQNELGTNVVSNASNDDSRKSGDVLNQGLFLTDETLASSSTMNKSSQSVRKRSLPKKLNDVNVDLMRLKVGFAMTRKSSKRLSLPSKLSLLKKDASNKSVGLTPPMQNKEKVQDWKRKISLHLRKSPQRRFKYKPPNKLQESAKRALASILRSGKSFSRSQAYDGDVEDCTQLSQEVNHASSKMEGNSGYLGDVECYSPKGRDESISVSLNSSILKHIDSSMESSLSAPIDSQTLEDSKISVLHEIRRSSRFVKVNDINSAYQDQQENLLRTSPKSTLLSDKNIEKIMKSSKKQDESLSHPRTVGDFIFSDSKNLSNCGSPTGSLSPTSRFSNRLSEKTKLILSKSTNKVIAQKSSNILSLMADAFKKTAPIQAPTTANILSSMAENFKKLDNRAQVSSSLSIQLVPAKSKHLSPKEKDRSDWGVQITRVQNTANKPPLPPQSMNYTLDSLPGINNLIPKSLSIEIIPESETREPSPRKGPSPPTVTISPEVTDLTDGSLERVFTQSTIHSIPRSPDIRQLAQGGSRWPSVKSERNLVQSPPQAVWKEKRSCSQTSDKVIIDIQTQDEPRQIPHCPVHCTCGARHGTCMGTMRNLIEEDADCLYEVPLSPEDFENSGAMIALGRGWIESCFEDPEDRDDFFQTYEDILPTVLSGFKQDNKPLVSSIISNQPHPSRGLKPPSRAPQLTSRNVQPMSNEQRHPPHPIQNQVDQSMKQAVRILRLSPTPSSTKKQTLPALQSNIEGRVHLLDKSKESKKRSSTDSERSESLLRDIEKKIRAYTNEQSKKVSIDGRQPARRTSSVSSSSSCSVPKSTRSSKRSVSPVLPPPQSQQLSLKKKASLPNVSKEEKKPDPSGKKRQHEARSSPSGSDSSEAKKSRLSELDRLTDLGKDCSKRRYRLSVRRSLDHLMTRQKLRSDRRIKVTSSSRS